MQSRIHRATTTGPYIFDGTPTNWPVLFEITLYETNEACVHRRYIIHRRARAVESILEIYIYSRRKINPSPYIPTFLTSPRRTGPRHRHRHRLRIVIFTLRVIHTASVCLRMYECTYAARRDIFGIMQNTSLFYHIDIIANILLSLMLRPLRCWQSIPH